MKAFIVDRYNPEMREGNASAVGPRPMILITKQFAGRVNSRSALHCSMKKSLTTSCNV
jgi:hypothetical protein